MMRVLPEFSSETVISQYNNGNLSFLLNKGNIVSMHSVTSNTSVIGSLGISQNIQGKRGVLLTEKSKLMIIGHMNLIDNSLSKLLF